MKKNSFLKYFKQKLKNLLQCNQTIWKGCVAIKHVCIVVCGNMVSLEVRFQQYCVHKKLSRVFQKHTRKIRIGFLVTENEKWCCQSLFDKLKNHPRFEPVIVLSSLTMDDRPLEQLREKFYKNREFFKKACGNIVEAYNPQTNTFLSLKSFGLDIIFYQQPWNIAKKHKVSSTAQFSLSCYVPYCFEDGIVMLKRNFYHFHGLLFREYSNHQLIVQDYIQAGFPKKHIKAVGWPKLESYLENTNNPKKYVIYAPHHSIEPNSIRLGTFAWNGQFMLEYAKKHPEFKWVFKPHPRCKVSFLTEGLFKSKQELDDYYDQWAKIGQVCEQGNYMDLFKQTRCLITDCSSFLVEFLPTEQPVIRLARCDENAAEKIIKQTATSYYQVYDLNNLQETLHTVLEREEDPLRKARLHKLRELQLVQPASDNIIKDLEESLF